MLKYDVKSMCADKCSSPIRIDHQQVAMNGKQLTEYMIYSVSQLFGGWIHSCFTVFTKPCFLLNAQPIFLNFIALISVDRADKTIDLLRAPTDDTEQMVTCIGRPVVRWWVEFVSQILTKKYLFAWSTFEYAYVAGDLFRASARSTLRQMFNIRDRFVFVDNVSTCDNDWLAVERCVHS